MSEHILVYNIQNAYVLYSLADVFPVTTDFLGSYNLLYMLKVICVTAR